MSYDILFLVILLVSALFIIIAVLAQKSSEEGLSGAIAGGSDTYYGKDKSGSSQRKWIKWTVIIAVIFAVAVAAVYIMQPDYSWFSTAGGIDASNSSEEWKHLLGYEYASPYYNNDSNLYMEWISRYFNIG